jgi:hypothetical protein
MVSAMRDESCSNCCLMNSIGLSLDTYFTFFLLPLESYFIDLTAKLHSMRFCLVSCDVTTILWLGIIIVGIFFPLFQCSFSLSLYAHCFVVS